MRCVVCKAFSYAHDGINFELLAEGAEPEIREELVPGLTEAGYLAAPEKGPKGKAKAADADAAQAASADAAQAASDAAAHAATEAAATAAADAEAQAAAAAAGKSAA